MVIDVDIWTCIHEIRLTCSRGLFNKKTLPTQVYIQCFMNWYSFFFCVSLLRAALPANRFSLSPWPAFMAASLACAATATGRKPRMARRRPRCGFWRPTTSTDAQLGSQTSWNLFEEANCETVNNLGMIAFKKQKSPVVCGVFNPYILESFFEVLWFCYDFVLRAILGLKESVQLYSCFWLARSKFPWTTPSRKMCNFIEPSRPWKSLPPLLCPASVEHEPPWMIFKKKCFWRSPLFRKGFNRKKGETYRLISWITRRSDGWNLASFSWAACLSSMASLRRVHLFGENQFFLAICAAHWDNISK